MVRDGAYDIDAVTNSAKRSKLERMAARISGQSMVGDGGVEGPPTQRFPHPGEPAEAPDPAPVPSPKPSEPVIRYQPMDRPAILPTEGQEDRWFGQPMGEHKEDDD